MKPSHFISVVGASVTAVAAIIFILASVHNPIAQAASGLESRDSTDFNSTALAFTLTNTGSLSTTFGLNEQREGGSNLPLVSKGAPLKLIQDKFFPGPLAGHRPVEPRLSIEQPSVPDDPPWTSIANYPFPVMDNTAVEWDGLIYSVGGNIGPNNNVSRGYVYNPNSNRWSPIAPMPTVREKPAAAFIDGRLYVFGGWDNSGNSISTLVIYNPGSDSWTMGASAPVALGASTGVALDGQFYVIGGQYNFNLPCTGPDLTCGTNIYRADVFRYDPHVNSWTTVAPYPVPVSWNACGAINGLIYCAGGLDENSELNLTYVYNPRFNTWTQVANMPQPQWAMGYTVADGQLYISGGVTNNFITNQGFAYDPVANQWTSIANSNFALYRGASACGFYKIGGAFDGFSQVSSAEVYPGLNYCLPWPGVRLTTSNHSGSGTPGAIVSYTVTLDNHTGVTDTFSLTLGSYAWDTALSASSIGPLAPKNALTFTVFVTVPLDAAWYLTNTVAVTATSVTSPTIYSTTASLTTQAYAPPSLSISPNVPTSTQYVNEVITKPITINNGNGVTLTYNTGVPIAGAALLMHLDEPAGATTFRDDSGNGNNGSCSGTSCPIAGVDGKFGRALSFDGIDDHIAINKTTNLELTTGTWGVWFKVVSGGGVILADEKLNGTQVIWSYRIGTWPSGQVFFDFTVDNRSQILSLVCSSSAWYGQWHQVTATRDDLVKIVKLYLDGEECTTSITYTGNIDNSNNPLWIGMSPYNNGSYAFSGLIDEVAIYNRALSAQEIESLYLYGATGKNVSWLSYVPISGTLGTNSNQAISVTFDSTGLQPGTYTTTMGIQSNDPAQPLASIPVTMTANPTANMGWVEGAITDARTGLPLTATVTLQGVYSTTAQPTYKIWATAGAYSLTVTAPGYVTQIVGVNLTAQQGLTRNLALVPGKVFLPIVLR